jgi:hypothetical protein
VLTGGYYMLINREERYCSHCIATRPRCSSCGAPVGADGWRLHDGRLQCAHCHPTAVYTPDAATAIYHETVAGIIAHLDLRLNVGVAFRMVDVPELQAVRAHDSGYAPHAGERMLGLYHRNGRLRVIYVLYGLPRLLFRTTVAHEYAHAWQSEHCPLLEDATLREGFAEWVAYHHLNWLGCTRAAQRMLQGNHPYRPALEHVLHLEQQMGMAAFLDMMRRAE